MKKGDIVDLIRCHVDGDEIGFRAAANKIANEFDENGDKELSRYISSLLTDVNTFVPQSVNDEKMPRFFTELPVGHTPLYLPDDIKSDIFGIVNAVKRKMIFRFIFKGKPGTGKTETVKQLGRLLDRKIWSVNFNSLIDYKLGETSKNMALMFEDLAKIKDKDQILVLFDEIDALAMDRVDNNDLREMGRATSAMLKGLDSIPEDIMIVATTNLFSSLDQALTRRFRYVIDFDRYSKDDLVEIGLKFYEHALTTARDVGSDQSVLRKILRLADEKVAPGDLKNVIYSAVAFNGSNDKYDHLKRILLYVDRTPDALSLKKLKNEGFTLREMEVLTGIPKSTAERELRENGTR